MDESKPPDIKWVAVPKDVERTLWGNIVYVASILVGIVVMWGFFYCVMWGFWKVSKHMGWGEGGDSTNDYPTEELEWRTR